MVDALRNLGYAPTEGPEQFLNHLVQMKGGGGQGGIRGQVAFSAPLEAGDMVMFLFDKCQYGGQNPRSTEGSHRARQQLEPAR